MYANMYFYLARCIEAQYYCVFVYVCMYVFAAYYSEWSTRYGYLDGKPDYTAKAGDNSAGTYYIVAIRS